MRDLTLENPDLNEYLGVCKTSSQRNYCLESGAEFDGIAK
jgi:hypothetical protein